MKLNRQKLRSLLYSLALVLLFFVPLHLFYQFAATLMWGFMFWIYFAALLAVILVCVLYNRAFVGTRVSRDALPPTWSEEEKDAFFKENETRLCRSRPLICLGISLFLVFFYDMVMLFLWDGLLSAFPFLSGL